TAPLRSRPHPPTERRSRPLRGRSRRHHPLSERPPTLRAPISGEIWGTVEGFTLYRLGERFAKLRTCRRSSFLTVMRRRNARLWLLRGRAFGARFAIVAHSAPARREVIACGGRCALSTKLRRWPSCPSTLLRGPLPRRSGRCDPVTQLTSPPPSSPPEGHEPGGLDPSSRRLLE